MDRTVLDPYQAGAREDNLHAAVQLGQSLPRVDAAVDYIPVVVCIAITVGGVGVGDGGVFFHRRRPGSTLRPRPGSPVGLRTNPGCSRSPSRGGSGDRGAPGSLVGATIDPPARAGAFSVADASKPTVRGGGGADTSTKGTVYSHHHK